MFKVFGSKILDTWIDNLKLLASLASHLLARGIFKQVLNNLSFSLVVDSTRHIKPHWLPVLCPSVIPTALQFVQICLQWRQNTTGTWIDFRNANILLSRICLLKKLVAFGSNLNWSWAQAFSGLNAFIYKQHNAVPWYTNSSELSNAGCCWSLM